LSILGSKYPEYREALRSYRQQQTESVINNSDPQENLK